MQVLTNLLTPAPAALCVACGADAEAPSLGRCGSDDDDALEAGSREDSGAPAKPAVAAAAVAAVAAGGSTAGRDGNEAQRRAVSILDALTAEIAFDCHSIIIGLTTGVAGNAVVHVLVTALACASRSGLCTLFLGSLSVCHRSVCSSLPHPAPPHPSPPVLRGRRAGRAASGGWFPAQRGHCAGRRVLPRRPGRHRRRHRRRQGLRPSGERADVSADAGHAGRVHERHPAAQCVAGLPGVAPATSPSSAQPSAAHLDPPPFVLCVVPTPPQLLLRS